MSIKPKQNIIVGSVLLLNKSLDVNLDESVEGRLKAFFNHVIDVYEDLVYVYEDEFYVWKDAIYVYEDELYVEKDAIYVYEDAFYVWKDELYV